MDKVTKAQVGLLCIQLLGLIAMTTATRGSNIYDLGFYVGVGLALPVILLNFVRRV